MRLQLWKNILRETDEGPYYIVKQKQRTGADDGSPSYETVIVGYGYKQEAPDGETYIDLHVQGFNNNKPK